MRRIETYAWTYAPKIYGNIVKPKRPHPAKIEIVGNLLFKFELLRNYFNDQNNNINTNIHNINNHSYNKNDHDNNNNKFVLLYKEFFLSWFKIKKLKTYFYKSEFRNVSLRELRRKIYFKSIVYDSV